MMDREKIPFYMDEISEDGSYFNFTVFCDASTTSENEIISELSKLELTVENIKLNDNQYELVVKYPTRLLDEKEHPLENDKKIHELLETAFFNVYKKI